ncbi:unnamed protein product [Miscanthus lutarioriparius]|uniref:Uncharacterized protein n=1 Tax=Miscanthus lutarioriparius TaxID=422564 RepID=A0A811Q809_9POAL|nr:unnamed protein product [Miscanthus lutarioriparius]
MRAIIGELVGNLDDQARIFVEGNNSALLDNTHMTTGADAIDWPNQHSRMDDGGGEERRDRGHNMGLGLQRLNRARRGKSQVVIIKGHIRRWFLLLLAKFASECNIIVRNHVPILPHLKSYKKNLRIKFKGERTKEKEPNEKEPKEKELASAYVDLFLGKLKAKFDINTEDNTVKKGCIEMMQSATQMENKLSTTTEGEELKSAAQVVADVLAENTKKNQFLQNVGYRNARRNSNGRALNWKRRKDQW